MVKGISNGQPDQGYSLYSSNLLHMPMPFYNHLKVSVLSQMRIAYHTRNRVLCEAFQHCFKFCDIL